MVTTRIQERKEMLVDLIRTTKGPVTLSELVNVTGIERGALRRSMNAICDENPCIRVESGIGRKSTSYTWTPPEKEERKTYRTFKNKEGYSDTTAEKAIESTDSPKKDAVSPGAGEVWSTTEANGSNGLIFVLNSLNGAAQCIKLYQDTSESREIVGSDPFVVGNYIGDATHATFKPLRYCIRCCIVRDDAKLMEARKRIAQAFGIRCFTPEVKEVENTEITKELKAKILELQNEIYRLKNPDTSVDIPEGYVDMKSVQIALLTEQRDIWKNIAEKLLAK
jgi:hypothetical protein